MQPRIAAQTKNLAARAAFDLGLVTKLVQFDLPRIIPSHSIQDIVNLRELHGPDWTKKMFGRYALYLVASPSLPPLPPPSNTTPLICPSVSPDPILPPSPPEMTILPLCAMSMPNSLGSPRAHLRRQCARPPITYCRPKLGLEKNLSSMLKSFDPSYWGALKPAIPIPFNSKFTFWGRNYIV